MLLLLLGTRALIELLILRAGFLYSLLTLDEFLLYYWRLHPGHDSELVSLFSSFSLLFFEKLLLMVQLLLFNRLDEFVLFLLHVEALHRDVEGQADVLLELIGVLAEELLQQVF